MAVVPPESKTVVLTGPVTLYEVSAVCDALRGAMVEGKPLRIDLSDTGPWDLAGLQLLISCASSARKRDLPVRLFGIPTSCAAVAERSGLSDWLKTVRE
jgi:ABC-type transporter Mla MlaB component